MSESKGPDGGASDAQARQRFARLQELFHELVDLPATERVRRLEDVRAESPELHDELAELLASETRGGSTLDQRERALDRLADEPEAVLVGADERDATETDRGIPERIGPYRVIRTLGEGGMGRVYEAEQTEPLVRRVAVKVLRHDAGSGVLTRFDAERRALAVMDHPNIARMLDAGATDDGKPWFAMELVDGVPVTRWAAEQGLDLDARIKLILPVCDAVQHAHLKGVIHRDLKPSNILVTEDDDGRAMPKVIDFGIAKAIEQPMLARTLATRFGELVGTPEYMSPEQAALGAVDVDTRSDVYALGLVLYELLVGELPLRAEDLRGLAFDEICRRIREDETPRPSTLLATRSTAPTHVPADQPKSHVTASTRAWTRRLRRDLDAVLLKALAKDRDRRYESAASFAGDLRRFLRDEAVEAAAPSWSYRAGKFVRRHRTAVVLSTLAVLSLAVGLVLAFVGLLQAREAEQRASEEARIATRTTDFLVDLFEVSDPKQRSEDPSARALLDRAADDLETDLDSAREVRARLLATLARVYANLGVYERNADLRRRQIEVLEQLDSDPGVVAIARSQLATALRGGGDLELAQDQAQQALADLEEAGLDDSLAAGRVLDGLASTHWALGDYPTARDHLLRSLELRTRHGDADEGWRFRALNNLAIMEAELGQIDDAREHYREALRMSDELWGADSAWAATTLNNLGNLEQRLDRHEEATAYLQKALEIRLRLLGDDHPDVAESLGNLGSSLLGQEAFEEAAEVLERAVDVSRRALGKEHPRTLTTRLNLTNALRSMGRLDEAKERLTELLPLFRQRFGEEHPYVSYVYLEFAKVELAEERRDVAVEWARRGLELRQKVYGDEHRLTEMARELLLDIESADARPAGGSKT